jgi:hypothetical protein
VGWGAGVFGENNTTWNLENPLRRDTLTVPAQSHVVLRWSMLKFTLSSTLAELILISIQWLIILVYGRCIATLLGTWRVCFDFSFQSAKSN